MKLIKDYNNNMVKIPDMVYNIIQKSYDKKYSNGYSYVKKEDIDLLYKKNFKSIQIIFLDETNTDLSYGIETNKKNEEYEEQETIEIIYIKKTF